MTESKHVLPGDLVCLPTRDPLLCPLDEKPDRETANTLGQLQYLEELVDRGVQDVRESHVLELHRIAIAGIFGCGGQYRTVTRTAELQGGTVTHVPPEPALIPSAVREALDRINALLHLSRTTRDSRERGQCVLDAAAFALWRFNWIHPFAGGNGRTSRAVAYLILCIDYGRMIPGKPSMPTLISRRRTEYERALREADAAAARDERGLAAMRSLVTSTIVEQLEQAVRHGELRRGGPASSEKKRARKAQRKARRKSRR